MKIYFNTMKDKHGNKVCMKHVYAIRDKIILTAKMTGDGPAIDEAFRKLDIALRKVKNHRRYLTFDIECSIELFCKLTKGMKLYYKGAKHDSMRSLLMEERKEIGEKRRKRFEKKQDAENHFYYNRNMWRVTNTVHALCAFAGSKERLFPLNPVKYAPFEKKLKYSNVKPILAKYKAEGRKVLDYYA